MLKRVLEPGVVIVVGGGGGVHSEHGFESDWSVGMDSDDVSSCSEN